MTFVEVPSLSSILAAAAAAAARPSAHPQCTHGTHSHLPTAWPCCGGTPGNPHCPGPSRYPPSSPRGQSQIQPNLPQIYEGTVLPILKPSFFPILPILPSALRKATLSVAVSSVNTTSYRFSILENALLDTHFAPPPGRRYDPSPWTAPSSSTFVAFIPVPTNLHPIARRPSNLP